MTEAILIHRQMMGDSLYMDWWPHWVSDLALQKNAIIISPNYRLLPEATSADIYADLDDFWTWLHSPALTTLLANHKTPTKLDLDRIFVTGESAGGLLSLYLTLAHPEEIRAASSAYPGLALDADSFTQPRANPPFGVNFPETMVQENFKAALLGISKSSITSQESLTFMLGAIQHGYLSKYYQRGAEGVAPEVLYPMARLESPDFKIPRGGIAILHGRQDSVVPLGDVELFVQRANEVLRAPSGEEGGVTLTVRDGEHGFDGPVRLEEVWLQDAMRKTIDVWLE
jgi:acetyl esterase/lipase